ncbi:hypothetical protein V8C42DRAFT_315153 [Trichoderma barbatum]
MDAIKDSLRRCGDDEWSVLALNNGQVVTVELPPGVIMPQSLKPTSILRVEERGLIAPRAEKRPTPLWIVGTVIGAFVTFAVLTGALFCILRQNRRQKPTGFDTTCDKSQPSYVCLQRTVPEADTNGVYELYVYPTPQGAEMSANEALAREMPVRDEMAAVELGVTRQLGGPMASSTSGSTRFIKGAMTSTAQL